MERRNVYSIGVGVLACAMGVYHLISAQYLLQQNVPYLNTHLGFCFAIVFLNAAAESRKKSQRSFYLVLFALSLLGWGYVNFLWEDLQDRAYFNTPLDLSIGVLLMFLSYASSKREFGWFLPGMSLIVVLYPFIGTHMPGPLHTSAYPWDQTISNLSIGLEGGVYAVVYASANFIFLFVLFGGILRMTAGTTFLMEISKLVGRRLRGGPAMMAIASSAFVGSIIGSPAANVAITGSVTIPLMKRAGYKPEYAAGIESAASNGGQIMPPVMGITAFAMAGMTGIPYFNIVIMALLPAILYFTCTGTYVYLRACQLNIGKMTEEVNRAELLKTAPTLVVPFALIMVLLYFGYTIMYVGFWAVISAVAVSLIRKKTRPSFGKLLQGFIQGAKAGAAVGCTVACVGPIMTTFQVSGIGIKLSAGIAAWSGGHLFFALVIVWVICVIMGMGGVSLTAYIIVTIFAVPALIKTGVGFEQAHFFCMFVAVFAFLTPPIALVAMVAAKMAEARYMQTAIESTKVAAGGFLLPFMFIYCPILLLKPDSISMGILKLIAVALGLITLEIGLVGYFRLNCLFFERALAIGSAVCLIAFLPMESFTIFIAGLVLFFLLCVSQWRKKKALEPAFAGPGDL
ncbi:MAG: TRAP transporter fused permease subunit [Deltaproteobacteria bacterium]|nr:TRAP transporter fused permease subunit [Deltaproteobacteria bacterium]